VEQRALDRLVVGGDGRWRAREAGLLISWAARFKYWPLSWDVPISKFWGVVEGAVESDRSRECGPRQERYQRQE
jgi:hypothetical protein